IEAVRDVRMHRPPRLLKDVEGADQKRLGFGVCALDSVERGESIEAVRDVRMHRPPRLLKDVEGADQKRLGFGVCALDSVERGEGMEAGRDVLSLIHISEPTRLLSISYA